MLIGINDPDLQEIPRLGVEKVIHEHQPVDLRGIGRRTGDDTFFIDLINQHGDLASDLFGK